MIGVNREEDAATARPWVEKHRLTYPVFLDEKRAFYARFTPKWIPYNVVLDPEGRVLYSASGFEEEKIRKIIDAELAKLEAKEQENEEEKEPPAGKE